MKVTTKGQVTIPQDIRDKYGIMPNSEVDFQEEDGRIVLVKRKADPHRPNRFTALRGTASVRMTTDEIMALTRSDD